MFWEHIQNLVPLTYGRIMSNVPPPTIATWVPRTASNYLLSGGEGGERFPSQRIYSCHFFPIQFLIVTVAQFPYLISRASVRVEPVLWMPAPGVRSLVLLASLQLSLPTHRLLSTMQPGAHCYSTGSCGHSGHSILGFALSPYLYRPGRDEKNALDATAMLYVDLPSSRRLPEVDCW